MAYPLLTQAQVINQDPRTGDLYVVLPSGQIPAHPVKFGLHGPADGVRVNHPAMPGRGTWGVVAFPGGDQRAGVWLCSFYSQMVDARSTNTDAFLEYNSHQSGFYESLDKNGQKVQFYPDGSFLVIGSTTALPDTFRHVVDDKQKQVLQQFTTGQRVPHAPSPFSFFLSTASGTTVEISPTGDLTITGGGAINITSPNTITLTGASIILNGISWSPHVHTGVVPGGGDTGPPA